MRRPERASVGRRADRGRQRAATTEPKAVDPPDGEPVAARRVARAGARKPVRGKSGRGLPGRLEPGALRERGSRGRTRQPITANDEGQSRPKSRPASGSVAIRSTTRVRCCQPTMPRPPTDDLERDHQGPYSRQVADRADSDPGVGHPDTATAAKQPSGEGGVPLDADTQRRAQQRAEHGRGERGPPDPHERRNKVQGQGVDGRIVARKWRRRDQPRDKGSIARTLRAARGCTCRSGAPDNRSTIVTMRAIAELIAATRRTVPEDEGRDSGGERVR